MEAGRYQLRETVVGWPSLPGTQLRRLAWVFGGNEVTRADLKSESRIFNVARFHPLVYRDVPGRMGTKQVVSSQSNSVADAMWNTALPPLI